MESNKVKVRLTCPKTHSDNLRIALGDAGFGAISNYSHCSTVTEIKGYCKPNDAADPFIGEAGKLEEIDEVIIEFRGTKDQLPKLKEILKEHHPYEEIGVDVFPLLEF
ncbi:hypothetical protein N8083_01915 [Candidatus Pacebacteria bacterium]|nr:hypothetical protein [Candidatus Paceibacterota bacterium]